MFHHTCTADELEVNPLPFDPDGDHGLQSDSAVYICWYLQLRELIDRCPFLAGKFKVSALPMGGFKGDWSLRVERGSVSRQLGKMIAQNLTTKQEHFERFRAGLGLPASDHFMDTQFYPWRGAKDVTLKNVMGIWEGARCRSRITNYKKFNRALYSLGELLAGRWLDRCDKDAKVDIDAQVERLPFLVTTLSA